MAKRGRPTNTQRVTKQLSDGTVQKQTAIATDMFLPNHSGVTDHPEFKAHTHSKLVASDGSPDPALSCDATGVVTSVDNLIAGGRLITQRYLGTPTTTNLISIQDSLIAYNTAMNVGGACKFFLKNSFGGLHTSEAPVDARSATPANKHKSQIILYDTTAMAAGVGGYNSYGGKYTAAGAYTIFGAIGGVKENATTGNFAGALSFRTRPVGGVMTGAEHMRITSTGNVGIGTSTPATSAKLDVTSTTGAFIPPRMTTAQRNGLTAVNGMIIYNSTTNAFNFYENGAWVSGSGLA